nr:transglutaminase domain-containing protein [Thiocapsa sp. KS1]
MPSDVVMYRGRRPRRKPHPRQSGPRPGRFDIRSRKPMKPSVPERPHHAGWLTIVSLILLVLAAIGSTQPLLAASADVRDPLLIPPDARYAPLRQAIDAAPPRVDDDLDALAAFLGGLANDDCGRAYAIYYWLSQNIAYDTKGFFTGEFGSLTPESVLQRREAVCSGYSRLFQALATRIGLDSREISGVSKGYGWSTDGTLGDHAWNAVRIDGQWGLIDATWGAGHLNDQNRFVRATDDFYFLTPPERFIYNHLPKDPAWQLLPAPISHAEFLALPDLAPAFFVRGLELMDNVGAVLKTGKQLSLELRSNQDVVTAMSVERNGQKVPEQHSFIERDGDRFHLQALLPMPGRYELRLFVKPADAPGPYDQAVRFTVDASTGAGGKAGFPQQTSTYQTRRVTGLAPLAYHLPAGQPQHFDLRVPRANAVALVNSTGEWHQLTAVGDRWRGNLAAPSGPLQLLAQFDPANNSYDVLVTYQVE